MNEKLAEFRRQHPGEKPGQILVDIETERRWEDDHFSIENPAWMHLCLPSDLTFCGIPVFLGADVFEVVPESKVVKTRVYYAGAGLCR